MGGPWRDKERRLHNAAFLLQNGRIAGRVTKHQLPNYGVFDEKRWFVPGPVPGPLALVLPGGESIRLGVMVCEDMWTEDVAEGLAESGAEILLVPNGSPFEESKQERRLQLAVARVTGARAAADLRQPAGRPGRAGVRRRLVRAGCPTAGW